MERARFQSIAASLTVLQVSCELFGETRLIAPAKKDFSPVVILDPEHAELSKRLYHQKEFINCLSLLVNFTDERYSYIKESDGYGHQRIVTRAFFQRALSQWQSLHEDQQYKALSAIISRSQLFINRYTSHYTNTQIKNAYLLIMDFYEKYYQEYETILNPFLAQ